MDSSVCESQRFQSRLKVFDNKEINHATDSPAFHLNKPSFVKHENGKSDLEAVKGVLSMNRKNRLDTCR
jgi:hypothetical protein